MLYVLSLLLIGSLFAAFFRKGGPNKPPSKIKFYSFLGAAFIIMIWMLNLKGGFLFLAIVLMVICFIGMLICAKYQKTYANAQNAAVALLVIIMVCMVVILTYTLGDWETERLIANELKYAKAASIVMGRNLAEMYPGSRALVVVNKGWDKNQRFKNLIDGLKEGVGDKLEIVNIDYPKIPPPPKTDPNEPDEMFMMEEMMKAEHFDKLFEKNRDCNLIISMIGLPYDVGEMQLWSMPKETRPQMALLFADVHNLKNAIRAGYIIALSYKPGVKFSEEDAPDDPQKAFDKRYIIITPKNVMELDEKYPGFFMKYK